MRFHSLGDLSRNAKESLVEVLDEFPRLRQVELPLIKTRIPGPTQEVSDEEIWTALAREKDFSFVEFLGSTISSLEISLDVAVFKDGAFLVSFP